MCPDLMVMLREGCHLLKKLKQLKCTDFTGESVVQSDTFQL